MAADFTEQAMRPAQFRRRWLDPPGLKQERRQAGDRAALLEDDLGNGNTTRNIAPQPRAQASLQALRRQRPVTKIWRLGPRVVFELIDELGRHHGLGEDIDRRLDRYAGIDPELLRAVGGDKFPRSPIRVITSDDR